MLEKRDKKCYGHFHTAMQKKAGIEIEIEGRKECLTAFEDLLNPIRTWLYDNKLLIQRAEGHVIFWNNASPPDTHFPLLVDTGHYNNINTRNMCRTRLVL